MAGNPKRIVGWINREEFEIVYDELFSTDISLQQHALDRIAVWKCRIQHKLSTAIELSSQLISTLLFYKRVQGSKENTDLQISLQLSVAMAVIRFVNLMTENKQKKLYAQPVHTVAEELGIPEWLVNLRHDATHSNMPSLNLLYKGLVFAICWLKEEFWEQQLKLDQSEKIGSDKEETDISNLLIQYKQERSIVTKYKGSNQSNFNAVFNELKAKFLTNKFGNLKILVEGFSKVDEEIEKQLQNSIKSNELTLLSSCIDFWLPVLKFIQSEQLLPHFILHMAEFVTEQNSLKDLYLICWINSFLKAFKSHTDIEDKKTSSSFSNLIQLVNNVKLDFKKILTILLHRPNKYTSMLLPVLYDLMGSSLNESQKTKLKEVLKLYNLDVSSKPKKDEQNKESMEIEEESTIFNKQTILKEYPEVYNIDDDSFIDDDNDIIWVEEQEINWTNYPLGSCPGYYPDFVFYELPNLQSIQRLKNHYHSFPLNKSRIGTFRNENNPMKKKKLPENTETNTNISDQIIIM